MAVDRSFFCESGWTWQKPNLKAFRFQMFGYFGASMEFGQKGVWASGAQGGKAGAPSLIYKSLFANGLSCYIVNYIHLCVCDNIIDVIYVLQHSCDFSEVKPTMVLIHAFCSPQAAKEGAFPKQKVGLSRDKRSTGLVTQALSCQS